jgi:hypothetical protein
VNDNVVHYRWIAIFVKNQITRKMGVVLIPRKNTWFCDKDQETLRQGLVCHTKVVRMPYGFVWHAGTFGLAEYITWLRGKHLT